MAHEWIRANAAYRYVSAALYESPAMQALCERAHSGLMATKATLIIREEEGKREERRDSILSKEFWWARGEEALEQDWQRGDFSTWIDQKIHLQAFDVWFDFPAVIDIVPAEARARAMAAISVAANDKWLAALKARQFISATSSLNPVSVERTMLEMCRSGHIAARAIRMESRARGWSGEPESVGVEWDVPPWFWRNFTEADKSSQQWDIGTFSGLGKSSNGSAYIKLTGVHFLRDSLSALAENVDAPPKSESQTRTIGGPGRRRKFDWDQALAHLVGLAELDGIASDPFAHGAQADIAGLLSKWFEENASGVPEDSQLRQYAKLVLDQIKEQSAKKGEA